MTTTYIHCPNCGAEDQQYGTTCLSCDFSIPRIADDQPLRPAPAYYQTQEDDRPWWKTYWWTLIPLFLMCCLLAAFVITGLNWLRSAPRDFPSVVAPTAITESFPQPTAQPVLPPTATPTLAIVASESPTVEVPNTPIFTVVVPPTPEGSAPATTAPNACAYNGDPIGPNMFTPTNVFVLDETVNYALKTVTSTFYFTSVPVQATINGQIHHNLWIYCSSDAANLGAQTEYAERFSEASQPGWAYGFTVSAPFGQ